MAKNKTRLKCCQIIFMKNKKKIILGIDPGTARMGYGIIEHDGNESKCLSYGVLETSAGIEDHLRLKDLYKSLNTLIKKYNPHVVAVEDIFYFKNQKTIIAVSQAKGIALLAGSMASKQCYSFTPLQIKQAVSGYGQADKKQIQTMVKTLLKLDKEPRPDDAADALAVAICCANSLRMLEIEQL